jgi:hypothetical protein
MNADKRGSKNKLLIGVHLRSSAAEVFFFRGLFNLYWSYRVAQNTNLLET